MPVADGRCLLEGHTGRHVREQACSRGRTRTPRARRSAGRRPGRRPRTRVTAEPTSSTTPANSMPRIRRLGRRKPIMKRQKNGFAARMWQSVRLTVVAWTRTSTSSSFGTGRSTSSTRSTSGGPYRSWTTALIGAATVHGQDDVAGLLPRLDVPRRLDDVLERIGAVDDRAVLARLDQLLDEEDVLLRVLGDRRASPACRRSIV